MKNPGKYLGSSIGRRSFLRAGSALAAGLFFPLAATAMEGRIHQLHGRVSINGTTIDADAPVRAGDRIVTRSDSSLWFTLNGDAFFMRGESELVLESARTSDLAIAGLRLVSGAFGATFARGSERSLRAPNVVIGIRGTGVYLEARNAETYACICFGAVELKGDDGHMMEHINVVTGSHFARRVFASPRDGMLLVEAPFEMHTNAEMAELERLAGRPDPFSGQR